MTVKQHTDSWGWTRYPGKAVRAVVRRGGGALSYIVGAGSDLVTPSRRGSNTRRTKRRGKRVYRVKGRR